MAYEFSIISLFPTGMILGWSYYPRDVDNPYNEVNLYLLFIQLQYRWADTTIWKKQFLVTYKKHVKNDQAYTQKTLAKVKAVTNKNTEGKANEKNI